MDYFSVPKITKRLINVDFEVWYCSGFWGGDLTMAQKNDFWILLRELQKSILRPKLALNLNQIKYLDLYGADRLSDIINECPVAVVICSVKQSEKLGVFYSILCKRFVNLKFTCSLKNILI